MYSQAAVAMVERFHSARVVEFPANRDFPLKAVEEDRVAFGLGMRHLDGNRAAVAHIDGAEDGCHAASGDEAFNPVAIDFIARADWGHNGSSSDDRGEVLNKS